jgi:hypothetical protein
LCQKCAKTHLDHLRLEKIFWGYNPRNPEGREEGRGEKKGRIREGKGSRGRGKRGVEGLQSLQKCLSVLAPGDTS